MLIHTDCFVLSYFLYLYSSLPDAEVYRIRWETKGYGSGDHCQSTVCTKGIQVPWSILEMCWFRVSLLCWHWNTSLFTLINSENHWYLKTARINSLCFLALQSMGTQDDDVGSKTSSYSWGHSCNAEEPSSGKNINLLSMDYIRGKPKMSAIIIRFSLSQRSHTQCFIYQCWSAEAQLHLWPQQ